MQDFEPLKVPLHALPLTVDFETCDWTEASELLGHCILHLPRSVARLVFWNNCILHLPRFVAGWCGGRAGMSGSVPSLLADFGQKIDLCSRIREILVNYPPGTTVLKEFVQNADDAGASKITFCLDTRSFGIEKLAHERMAPFQGHSLLVHNDAVFSDVDFESIQNIGEDSPSHPPDHPQTRSQILDVSRGCRSGAREGRMHSPFLCLMACL